MIRITATVMTKAMAGMTREGTHLEAQAPTLVLLLQQQVHLHLPAVRLRAQAKDREAQALILVLLLQQQVHLHLSIVRLRAREKDREA